MALIENYYQAFDNKRFDQAEAAIGKMRAIARNETMGKGVTSLFRVPILVSKGDEDGAWKLLEDAYLVWNGAPDATTLIFPPLLASGKLEFTGRLVDRLITRAPDAVRELPPEWVYASFHDKKQPARTLEDRRIALAEIGFGGNNGDHTSKLAIGFLIDRGELARAQALLPYIDDPESMVEMLILRRFETLWPAIAARSGPNMQKIRDENVRAAQQSYEEKGDHETLADLIRAYLQAGRLADAIALRDKLPGNPAEFAKADEYMGWAINNLALSLHAAKRPAEADLLFASLNDAVPANHWRVNMFINRAELLVNHGKFEEALPLIAKAEKESKSPYAEQLLRSYRYCASARLGRTADLAAQRQVLLNHAKDSVTATVESLICSGQVDEAERVALANLDDREFQADFVDYLNEVRMTGTIPPVWGGWDVLRKRPAIAAAFARLGRDLPQEFAW